MAKVSINLGRTIKDVQRAANKADKRPSRKTRKKVAKIATKKRTAKSKDTTHPRMKNMPSEYSRHMKDPNYAKAVESHRKKGHTWESSHSFAKKQAEKHAAQKQMQKRLEGYKAHKPITTIHENRGKEVANIKAFKRVEKARQDIHSHLSKPAAKSGPSAGSVAKGYGVSAKKANWQKPTSGSGFKQQTSTIYGSQSGPKPTPMVQSIHDAKNVVKGGMQKLRQIMAPSSGSKDYNQTWKQRKEASEMGKSGTARRLSKVSAAWGHMHDLANKGLSKVGRLVKGAISAAGSGLGKTQLGKDLGTLKQRMQPIAKGWESLHNSKQLGQTLKKGVAKAGNAMKSLRKKTLGFRASKRVIALSR